MSKLYVLVRNDLAKNYQAVQAGHAVAEFCKNEASRWRWNGREMEQLPWRWNNGTLIYLRVKNKEEMDEWNLRLTWTKSEFYPFQEPDMDDEVTAMAVLSDPNVDKMFETIKLL